MSKKNAKIIREHPVNQHRASERGNVMFYIFIAVILLAALSYTIAESSRGNVQQLTSERARIYASELIEYANVMTSAVAQLRLRGVDVEDLCFDDTAWGVNDYDHAGCTDDANKLYSPSGAGLIWTRAPEKAMDESASPDKLWHIYGNNEVQDVGTTCGAAACADLILVVDELAKETCIQINELLGIDNPAGSPPTDSDIGETRYIGVFSYAHTLGDEAGGSAFTGKTAACFQRLAAPTEYTFYKVLIAR